MNTVYIPIINASMENYLPNQGDLNLRAAHSFKFFILSMIKVECYPSLRYFDLKDLDCKRTSKYGQSSNPLTIDEYVSNPLHTRLKDAMTKSAYKFVMLQYNHIEDTYSWDDSFNIVTGDRAIELLVELYNTQKTAYLYNFYKSSMGYVRHTVSDYINTKLKNSNSVDEFNRRLDVCDINYDYDTNFTRYLLTNQSDVQKDLHELLTDNKGTHNLLLLYNKVATDYGEQSVRLKINHAIIDLLKDLRSNNSDESINEFLNRDVVKQAIETLKNDLLSIVKQDLDVNVSVINDELDAIYNRYK